MHRARMRDEVESRPGVSREEFGRQHVSLQPIAPCTGKDDVARNVGAAVRERVHVVERREVEVEGRGAVDTAASTVAHRRALDRSLLMAGRNVLAAAGPRESGKSNTVKVPTSGHVTSLKRRTPRREVVPRQGYAPISEVATPMGTVALAPLSWWRRSTCCEMSDEWAHRPPVGTREQLISRAPYKCTRWQNRARGE